jgi:epoxyqueuosine reductase
VKEQIREKAIELGFDLCRVTSAERPGTAALFEEWLKKNHHGEMAYLARNAHKRVDPRQVLGEARSIIILATS